MSPTARGRRIVAPPKESDDQGAKREAPLRPRVVRDFLTRYNGSRLPTESIGRNVLEEAGVPTDKTAYVYAIIIALRLSLYGEQRGLESQRGMTRRQSLRASRRRSPYTYLVLIRARNGSYG